MISLTTKGLGKRTKERTIRKGYGRLKCHGELQLKKFLKESKVAFLFPWLLEIKWIAIRA
jgi:hypothetical protein